LLLIGLWGEDGPPWGLKKHEHLFGEVGWSSKLLLLPDMLSLPALDIRTTVYSSNYSVVAARIAVTRNRVHSCFSLQVIWQTA
jgi:hypothetical protein